MGFPPDFFFCSHRDELNDITGRIFTPARFLLKTVCLDGSLAWMWVVPIYMLIQFFLPATRLEDEQEKNEPRFTIQAVQFPRPLLSVYEG